MQNFRAFANWCIFAPFHYLQLLQTTPDLLQYNRTSLRHAIAEKPVVIPSGKKCGVSKASALKNSTNGRWYTTKNSNTWARSGDTRKRNILKLNADYFVLMWAVNILEYDFQQRRYVGIETDKNNASTKQHEKFSAAHHACYTLSPGATWKRTSDALLKRRVFCNYDQFFWVSTERWLTKSE